MSTQSLPTSIQTKIQAKIKNVNKEENRLFLRGLGLKSLFLFNRIFIEPVVEPDPKKRLALPKYLFLPVLDFIQDDSIYRKGLLMPRYFFKSTTVTEAKPIWDYLHDHNERVLIANETFDNASDMLGHIADHIKNNMLLRYCYPELKVSDEWIRKHRFSSKAIDMPRTGSYKEATFTAIGVGGAAQSRHYTKIYLDDLIGKRARESTTVRADTENWFGDVEQLLAQPDISLPNASHLYITATHWAPGDLYQKIMESDKRYHWKVIPGEQPDGTPTWPERLSAKKIAWYRSTPRNMIVFYTQIQNNPKDTELTDFKERWLKFYRLVSLNNEKAVEYVYMKSHAEGEPTEETKTVPINSLYIEAVIDPAYSDKHKAQKRQCLTAIVVVGTDRNTNKRIVLEAWGAQISQPRQLYDKVFEFDDKYTIRRWGVDATGPQQFVAKAIREEAQKRKRSLPLMEFKKEVGANAKELRILALQDDFAMGNIYVRPDFGLLLAEYGSFPMDEHRDLLDALGYHKSQFNWTRRNTKRDGHAAKRRYNNYIQNINPYTGY